MKSVHEQLEPQARQHGRVAKNLDFGVRQILVKGPAMTRRACLSHSKPQFSPLYSGHSHRPSFTQQTSGAKKITVNVPSTEAAVVGKEGGRNA